MDILYVLIAIGLIHCTLFFFDTIFKSCCHFPYIYLLENSGLEVQLMRIKWFTTTFNRKIMKWGMNRSKFWTTWFNAGVIISIILLLIVMIEILRVTFNICSVGLTVQKNSPVLLKPMLPGVDMPLNEIGYYLITLAMCIIFHELGHALAAVREDVQLYGVGILLVFVIPIAYVNMNSEQFVSLPLRNQLRIMCAGVWHNIILAAIAATILVLSTWFWAPLYDLHSGVYVKSILPNSPSKGSTGLLEHDVIYKLNDCPVKHSDDWSNCILNIIRQPTPGYCVQQSFIQEYDESVASRQKNNEVVNCCTLDNELSGSLCFEYIEGPQAAPLHLPPHSCLPVRTMIDQSPNYCQASYECSSPDTHCIKPSLDNITKIVQIKRKVGKDVLVLGYPADIYRTVDVSDWVPKYSFLNPKIPESLVLLCKYVTMFSAGLAAINVVPCFFSDGQYIINILVLYVSHVIPLREHTRQVLTLTITSIGTIFLSINIVYLLMNKLV
ncbi:hypothetical protein KPH14_006290 [Odynerus spinipes]|uniref:Membrane-bound transcription factor site-2 protease n=1 Tax=Odynerus spinipes TaxID=1348599 RepID=A0AAD9VSU9_9HYME|nr:hypothetical protein KPH14_006290 [Odynerus spinipes]